MIQIYSPGNKDFDRNGDMTLFPEDAKVKCILNGMWTAEISHPMDSEGRWRYIVEDAVVKMQSFNGEQLFRIKRKEKSEDNVEAYLEPIFMDSKDDCFLVDIRPTGKNGQQALDDMIRPNTKYSASSNITKVETAYYITKNLIEAINGDDDNSFINRWGGEILFDNFKVFINERIGRDNGIELRYGKNIKRDGIHEEIDVSEIATRIYPKAYNGRMMSGKGYIDSELINKYPVVRTKTISFDDIKLREDAGESEDTSVTICNTQEELDKALEKRCKEIYASGEDKPKVMISIDMELLEGTDEYREYKGIETVSLGDTVHVRHRILNIIGDARVIELEYDSIRRKVTSVVVGDFKSGYFGNVTSAMNRIEEAIRDDGTVIGEQVKGIIDGIRAMMRTQANNAHPSPVRSMIFEDLVEGSPTFGALCLGTMGFQIANKRTADGKEWDWRTFGTGAGFFADLIVAGTMLADRIRAGKLQSQDYVEGKSGFELDLDTGIITFYGSDDSGNASKLLFEKGGITITNLATGSVGKASIRYQKVGDDYFPIISGTDGEQGYSMNQNALVYMMGTLIKASMGISGGKGYVNTDTLNVRESIMSGNRKGISQVIKCAGGQAEFVNGICVSGTDGTSGLSGRAEFSDGSYMQFENGLFVGGYTTEGGGIS